MPLPDGVVLDADLTRVDWTQAVHDLRADHFDNGRSPAALRRSFENSAHVALAWHERRLVGMARLLSDGVCNAYLLDVWTASALRRRGIGSALVGRLADLVPGQHIALQTDDAADFYAGLGFTTEPGHFFRVVGTWLDNDANRG